MRKSKIIFGAVVIALLMVLTVTAVPQVQSKAVMDQIEQEEMIDSEYVKLYNLLIADGVINIHSNEEFYLDPNDELEKLYDEDGFINHLLSDKVIQTLNECYSILVSNDVFQYIFNSGPVQDFIQSDEFIAFRNSDEAQYIFDNFNPNNQNLLDDQQVAYILDFNVYQQYASACNIGEYERSIAGSEDIFLSSSPELSLDGEPAFWFPGFFLVWSFALFLALFIGILTWPFAIALYPIAIIFSPLIFLDVWIYSVMYFFKIEFGWAFPIISLGMTLIGAFLAAAVITLLVVIWPLVGWIVLLCMWDDFINIPSPV